MSAEAADESRGVADASRGELRFAALVICGFALLLSLLGLAAIQSNAGRLTSWQGLVLTGGIPLSLLCYAWLHKSPRARPAWLAALLLAVCLSTSGPKLVNAALTPADWQFTGLMAQESEISRGVGSDAYTYVSKLRQGSEGQWLYQNRYSEEPHAPALLFSVYLLLGRLLGWLGLDPVTGFLLLSAACALLPIFPLLGLTRRLLPDAPAWQHLAAFAALFGLGLSWIEGLVKLVPRQSDPYLSGPADLVIPEFSAFQALSLPHFALSLACMLGLLCLLLRGTSTWRQAAGLALLAGLLALIHPFDYLQIALSSLVYLLLEWLHARRLSASQARLSLLCGALGLLPSALIYAQITGDQMLRQLFSDNNQLVSPLLPALLIGLGSPLLICLLGAAWQAWQQRKSGAQLLPAEVHQARNLLWIWLGVGLLLAYAPIGFQRRFLVGMYLPAALLAWLYLRAFSASLRQSAAAQRLRYACLGLYLLSLLPTTFKLLDVSAVKIPLAQTRALGEMHAWLNQRGIRGRLIFSRAWIGLTIPAMTGNRAWVGHWSETLDYYGKAEAAGRFWQLPLPEQARFLNMTQADLLLAGPEDAPETAPHPALNLAVLHAAGPYRLYGRLDRLQANPLPAEPQQNAGRFLPALE